MTSINLKFPGSQKDVLLGEYLGFGKHAAGHGFKSEGGYKTRDTAGIFKHGLQRGLTERGFIQAFCREDVGNEWLKLLFFEGIQMEIEDNPLVKRVKNRAHEPLGEMGLTGDEDDGGVSRIHGEI